MRPHSKIKSEPRTWRGEPTASWAKSAIVWLGFALFFVCFAALITWMAPTYSLELRRNADGVSACVEQRLLWWIPWRSQKVAKVSGVRTAIGQPEQGEPIAGELRAEVRPPEAIGYLGLLGLGSGEEARVMVSPIDLPETRRSVEDFLRGGPPQLRLRCVANWKAGVLAPAIVAGFGALLLLVFLLDSLCRLFLQRSRLS